MNEIEKYQDVVHYNLQKIIAIGFKVDNERADPTDEKLKF